MTIELDFLSIVTFGFVVDLIGCGGGVERGNDHGKDFSPYFLHCCRRFGERRRRVSCLCSQPSAFAAGGETHGAVPEETPKAKTLSAGLQVVQAACDVDGAFTTKKKSPRNG
jgi:hypothetical protein